jgi:hypothetical protein
VAHKIRPIDKGEKEKLLNGLKRGAGNRPRDYFLSETDPPEGAVGKSQSSTRTPSGTASMRSLHLKPPFRTDNHADYTGIGFLFLYASRYAQFDI